MAAFLYPYKQASEGGKALAEALDLKRIALTNSKFKGAPEKFVINWGSSTLPEEVQKCKVLNKAEAVALASNKLHTFTRLEGADIMPAFTTDIDRAASWIRSHKSIIVERHVLQGNSGDGIRIVEDWHDLQRCPLYVLYIPKKQEYRVHVLAGEVVDVQRKARRHDVPDDQINWRVRNHDNGFVFARHEELGEVPARVLTNAVRAVQGLRLDFGAVDVVYNEKAGKAYVLEVNTAPGMTGETLEGYARRFSDLIQYHATGRVAPPAGPTIGGESFHDYSARVLADIHRRREAGTIRVTTPIDLTAGDWIVDEGRHLPGLEVPLR